MNLKEISIQKLMKATFAVLIGLSVINTLVMLGAGTKGEGLTSNFPLLVSVLANLIFIILFSMISLYIIKKRVIDPLEELEKDMEEISKGNLSTKIRHESSDEFGHFADNFRRLLGVITEYINGIQRLTAQMADGDFDIEFKNDSVGDFKAIDVSLQNLAASLGNMIHHINESFSQVSSGSSQVADGAQMLSQGATEQASAIEQLSAAIMEISDQINQNAKSANTANQKVANLGSEIEQTNEQMEEMMSAMNEINHTSGEIGKIIKTIEDIAFQTNILALNAAVEAARAGAAGKGFAVVADEVRNLANKSAEAAKNTTVLIQSSIKAVDNGTRIASETARLLENIDRGSREIVENVDQISQKSQEQAVSVSQVTDGIDQISSVVQMNSATSEEAAAASQELSSQAHMMKAELERFRYRKGGYPSKPAAVKSEVQKPEAPKTESRPAPKKETRPSISKPTPVKKEASKSSPKPELEIREVKSEQAKPAPVRERLKPAASSGAIFNPDKY